MGEDRGTIAVKPSPLRGEGWAGVDAVGLRAGAGGGDASCDFAAGAERAPPSPGLPPSRGKGGMTFPLPSTSKLTRGPPTGTCEPAAPCRATTLPATGEVISTVALSVMMSARI